MNDDNDNIKMNPLRDSEGEFLRLHRLPENGQEEHEDEDVNDAVHSALLGSSGRARGLERERKILEDFWAQAKGIITETGPTLCLMTVGLLFTGEMLDKVSKWTAMQQVHQLIIIIPVVMNLKGNLEMNLSARLGTAANVGELDDPEVRWPMVVGNLTLLQVQATVVSFIAACIALLVSLALPQFGSGASQEIEVSGGKTHSATNIVHTLSHLVEHNFAPRRPIKIRPNNGKFTFQTLVIVSSTAMTSACVSSMVLGSFVCSMIILCRRFGLDPDNIAPPIASFLSDLVTLTFIGITSSILVSVINTPIPLIVCFLAFILATFCLVSTNRNKHVRALLRQGWSPLFGAMAISSCTGVVLDRFVSQFEGFALLAVVISGLPGAVGCILASRLSTSLHAAAMSIVPDSSPGIKTVTLTLILVTLPIEIAFVSAIGALGWLKLPVVFLVLSVGCFSVAVWISLHTARILTYFLWSKNCDPDAYALPIHSAMMDLVGQLLLAVCYEFASLVLGTNPKSNGSTSLRDTIS